MHAATLTAVVVFPTPPFWLAMAYTMPIATPDASGDRGGSGRWSAFLAVLVRFQRRVLVDSGRLVAIPGRRGYFAGVGATFRTTCSVRRAESGNGTTVRTDSRCRPRCAAAASASAASSLGTAPFHATSTPPCRNRGAAYS